MSLGLLRHFVHLLPLEETFLQVDSVPPGTQLSPELVALNYSARSPFGTPHLQYRLAGERLEIYYAREPLPTGWRVVIPESYLLAKAHAARGEALLQVPRAAGTAYLVLKEGRLAGQVCQPREQDTAQTAKLLLRQYGLTPDAVVPVAPGLRPAPDWADLWAFSHRQGEGGASVGLLWQGLQAVVVSVLLVLAIYQLGRHQTLQGRVAAAQVRVARVQEENGPLRSRYEEHRARAGFWQEFLAQESTGPSCLRQLQALAGVMAQREGALRTVRYSPEGLRCWVRYAGQNSDLISALLGTGVFAEAKILQAQPASNGEAGQFLQLELRAAGPAVPAAAPGEAG